MHALPSLLTSLSSSLPFLGPCVCVAGTQIQEELDREAMKEQVQKVFTGVWSAASGLVAAAAEAQKTCVHITFTGFIRILLHGNEIAPSLSSSMLKGGSSMQVCLPMWASVRPRALPLPLTLPPLPHVWQW